MTHGPRGDGCPVGGPGTPAPVAPASLGARVRRAEIYAAPSPGAEPFVRVGDEVEAGQTLGIVEAMKLMNPILADAAGVVAEIRAGDAESVEYDQVLLLLRPPPPTLRVPILTLPSRYYPPICKPPTPSSTRSLRRRRRGRNTLSTSSPPRTLPRRPSWTHWAAPCRVSEP